MAGAHVRRAAIRRLWVTVAYALVVSMTAACSADTHAHGAVRAPSTPSGLQRSVVIVVSGSGLSRPAVSGRVSLRSRPASTGRTGGSVFADPVRVALAEAMASCGFDWRQSLQQRIAGGAVYATRTYAARLRDVSEVDRSNWAGTQADRATGTCRMVRVFVIAGAPNTATTRFVRVVLTQTVSSPATAAQSSAWVATYRLLRGSDGRWLVDAELDGGG